MTCKTFTPHPYQQYCINRIVESPTVGLFLDMGLGKTAITLMAIRCLKFDCWAVNRVGTDPRAAGGRGAGHGGSSAAGAGYTGRCLRHQPRKHSVAGAGVRTGMAV